MSVLPLFVSTVVLPLAAIALLWRRALRPLTGWVATLILASGLTAFSVLVAPWGFFGLPLRYAIAGLFVFALVVSVRRPPEEDALPDAPVRQMVKVLIGLFFGMVALGVLRAHAVPLGALDLRFPLRDGTYLIVHGGSESAANQHAHHPAQRYGLDIVKLNAAGTRAAGLFPKALTSYAIFGAGVLSPCDGTVVRAVDGLPDLAPGIRDETRKEGNHVVVRCGDADVLLAHLGRGSVTVRANTRVTAGTLLGKVGNSGNTTEPHLHIHAERNGIGVPARFDGKWLVRNGVVRR